LDDKCSIFKELVSILGLIIDACKDLDKIDIHFINQTQRFINGFNEKYKTIACHLDLLEAIQAFMVENTHPEYRPNSRDMMMRVTERFKQVWNDYKKPAEGVNATAVGVFLKLYTCVCERRFRSSTLARKFHNVFIMAYDTGADNRYGITKLFKGRRPTLKSCVAFTSIDGLHRSTSYNEAEFEPKYREIQEQIEGGIIKFLSFLPTRNTKEQIDMILVRLDKLEVSVQELRDLSDERGKMHELARSLQELLDLSHKMEKEGTLDEKEGKRILEEMNAAMKRFSESDASAEEAEETSEEIEHLHKHLIDMKKHVAKHAKAINGLIEFRDRTISLQEALVSTKEEWEERVIEIEKFAHCLEREEERLKAIAEGATKKLIIAQYIDAEPPGRLCLRLSFPWIKTLKLKLDK